MHTTRLTLTFALAAGFAIAQIPDAPGVTVELNGATLLHRSTVSYPEAARTKNIKGSVTVEVTLDASGNVSDTRVLSGPDELRKPVLQSVLGWHFANATAGTQRQVTVAFNPLAGANPEGFGARAEEMRAKMIEQARQAEAKLGPRTVQSVQVVGLPDTLKSELLAKLPLRAGDTISLDAMEKAARVVREFDEHMTITTAPAGAPGLFRLEIGTMDARAVARTEVAASSVPGRINVGGNIQQARLVTQPKPLYPPDAKEARIQGVVKLAAVIAKDGTVAQLELIGGHPLLASSAMDAVRQWVYQPTMLNGTPVEVSTQIDVNYTLSQ